MNDKETDNKETEKRGAGGVRSHVTRLCSQEQSRSTLAFLSAVYVGRICQGLCWSLFSPTLLFLADNVRENVASVSVMLTGRSLGFMVGALSAGLTLKYKNPIAIIGFAMCICSITLFVIPFVTSLLLLISVATVCGVMIGCFDAGLQGVILNIWGEKRSRVHIQIFHFAFVIGATIAPIMAKPFLEEASLIKKQEASCPHSNINDHGSLLNISATQSQSPVEKFNGINPISFVFIIGACFCLAISCHLLALAYFKTTDKIKKDRLEKNFDTEQRPEEPFRKVACFFVLVTLFYFFFIGAEHPFVAFIFAIAICSELHFTESSASLINSLFWGGFVAGRLAAVFVSKYIKPRTIIVTCVLGTLLSMVLMTFFGRSASVIPWIAAFAYGLFAAPIYPSFVSWISRFANISGKYIFVINLGNGIGSMSMVPVGGAIFQQDPFSVMYFIVAMIAMNCVVLMVLMIYGKKRWKDAAGKREEGDPASSDLLTSSGMNRKSSNNQPA